MATAASGSTVARNFIHGKWVESSSKEIVERRNPANLDEIVATISSRFAGFRRSTISFELDSTHFPCIKFRATVEPLAAVAINFSLVLRRSYRLTRCIRSAFHVAPRRHSGQASVEIRLDCLLEPLVGSNQPSTASNRNSSYRL